MPLYCASTRSSLRAATRRSFDSMPPPSPLERDRALLASIRGTSTWLRYGNAGKVTDDVLMVMRRKLAEECAGVLQKEIARLEALTVAHPHAHDAHFAVQRLKE